MLWGIAELANPAYLRRFLFSGLPYVAPYCVPGVPVVSKWYQDERTLQFDPGVLLCTVLPHAGLAGARTMVWARSTTRSFMKSLEMWFRTVFGLTGGLGPFTPFRTLD